MADGNFKMHSICMMGEYNMYSPEELRLQDVSNGGKNAAAAGAPSLGAAANTAPHEVVPTLSASSQSGSSGPELMFNGDLSGRFWETSGQKPHWVIMSSPEPICELSIYQKNHGSYSPSEVRISGRGHDGDEWCELRTLDLQMASSSDSWTTLVGDEQIGGQEYHELKFEILENDSGGYDSKVTALRLMARAAAVKLPAAVNHSPPRVVRSLCRLLCAAPERASAAPLPRAPSLLHALESLFQELGGAADVCEELLRAWVFIAQRSASYAHVHRLLDHASEPAVRPLLHALHASILSPPPPTPAADGADATAAAGAAGAAAPKKPATLTRRQPAAALARYAEALLAACTARLRDESEAAADAADGGGGLGAALRTDPLISLLPSLLLALLDAGAAAVARRLAPRPHPGPRGQRRPLAPRRRRRRRPQCRRPPDRRRRRAAATRRQTGRRH